jgi:hypothetical protein
MQLVINPLGLVSETPFRGVVDGITYFGRKKSIKRGTNDPNAETTNQVIPNRDLKLLVETDSQ